MTFLCCFCDYKFEITYFYVGHLSVQLVINLFYLQLLLGTRGQHVIGLHSFDPHKLFIK